MSILDGSANKRALISSDAKAGSGKKLAAVNTQLAHKRLNADSITDPLPILLQYRPESGLSAMPIQPSIQMSN